MDGEAGWWTTSGNIGLPPLARAMGVGRQQQQQLKHLGARAHRWLHSMLNTCYTENKIPNVWRQSRIIVILKPEKYASISKSYRPISLLCHTCKLYERLILNIINPTVESHLIKEQDGFRPGKSCTNQLLNLLNKSRMATRIA